MQIQQRAKLACVSLQVNTRDGSIADTYLLQDDFVHASHNFGVHLWDDLLLIVGVSCHANPSGLLMNQTNNFANPFPVALQFHTGVHCVCTGGLLFTVMMRHTKRFMNCFQLPLPEPHTFYSAQPPLPGSPSCPLPPAVWLLPMLHTLMVLVSGCCT
jgi:hypothetical protein